MRVWPGNPYPLGATWDGAGVNFALFADHATKVELCLFDGPEAQTESERIPLPEYTDMVWHGYLPDARPGAALGHEGLLALHRDRDRGGVVHENGVSASGREGGQVIQRQTCDASISDCID